MPSRPRMINVFHFPRRYRDCRQRSIFHFVTLDYTVLITSTVWKASKGRERRREKRKISDLMCEKLNWKSKVGNQQEEMHRCSADGSVHVRSMTSNSYLFDDRRDLFSFIETSPSSFSWTNWFKFIRAQWWWSRWIFFFVSRHWRVSNEAERNEETNENKMTVWMNKDEGLMTSSKNDFHLFSHLQLLFLFSLSIELKHRQNSAVRMSSITFCVFYHQ